MFVWKKESTPFFNTRKFSHSASNFQMRDLKKKKNHAMEHVIKDHFQSLLQCFIDAVEDIGFLE